MSGVTCMVRQEVRQKSGRKIGSRSWLSLGLEEVKAWPVFGYNIVAIFSSYER